MLTPDYLDTLPDALVELWQQVEEDILRDIARRIAKMNSVTDTAGWQLWRFEQIQALHQDVAALLAKYSGKTDAELRRLLLEAGRYPAGQLREDYEKGALDRYAPRFRQAAAEAREALAASGDPQAADLVLDRACYAELLEAAQASGSAFLEGYVRLSIDVADLRSAVRSARTGRGAAFLQRVLLPGGAVDPEKLAAAVLSGAELAGLYAHGWLSAAAEAGDEARKGGPLTRFERLCDDALTHYLSQARRAAFGEQPLIGYLYAKESELTAIRVILTGQLAGLDTETIRERLRDSYV